MLEMLLMLSERISDDSIIVELVLQCISAVLKKESSASLLDDPDSKDVSTLTWALMNISNSLLYFSQLEGCLSF